MRLLPVLLACSLICLARPSRCPEPRKPHLTSCTIFYNCVNLPGGGYVWVPSKCSEGLVFQPYLRICVVPGDIWTCDTLSTERAPALIDSTGTSYLGYTQEPPGLAETIDSSYVIDDFYDSTTKAVTAYPLIEFEESDGKTRGDEDARNSSCHGQENYLHEYTSSQGQLPLSLVQKYKDVVDNHYKWLNRLSHTFEELSAALSASPSTPAGDVEQTVVIFASRGRNVSFNYLAQSYAERDESHNGAPTEAVGSSGGPQASSVATTAGGPELLIDSLDSDNSIIRISDNLGSKQYLTVERYRAVAHRLAPRAVSVVACTRNVRLPNGTDCSRYYTCEPKTAAVVEYFCPPHTAFNVHSRICDVESARTCAGDRLPAKGTHVERVEDKSTAILGGEETPEGRVCRELGKMKDPASDSHYFICHGAPDSEDIKSIRMTCPNTLIFCQSKKVCTTRRLCDALP
ncbi:PREDICTED: uncharacterized protein LOC105567487 [Vollenhovia emeryi]|uniref:uncharacterized protein LOC105567487 n=1 Tax=Vollenhovia emeryi TaxID=411798 RepID=UPI0005F4F76F|nr:PREDICTED: uncharacterized protein LOC105567487 [Vollenhovia emeryi]